MPKLPDHWVWDFWLALVTARARTGPLDDRGVGDADRGRRRCAVGIWPRPPRARPGRSTSAALVGDHSRYAGRLVRDRTGRSMMLAFHNTGPDGTFVAAISDPMQVTAVRGGLALPGRGKQDHCRGGSVTGLERSSDSE